MTEPIRQRARELGFDDCRFTTADPPGSAPQFQDWLARGFQGEMAYLARNAPKRLNPRLVLPGARSLITLAASYIKADSAPASAGKTAPHPSQACRLHPDETALTDSSWLGKIASQEPTASHGSDESPPQGREARPAASGLVARYAGFADYHEVLGEGLKALAQFADQLGGPGTKSLWYTDTGPILERDLAQRAGLGFIGKHASLVSRRLGNWFFLAEILTTLELEPDLPETNHCGSCRRCLAACPTGALVAPFQLDARLCISYLTIELKGPIPVELRPAIGNRIFGCDDCLAACPWNRFGREGHLMKGSVRSDLTSPSLIEWLGLGEAEFKVRFAGTPMARAKRRGLLRNVCVALGNTAGLDALPALERAAADPEPLIAEHAQWAISELKRRSKETSPTDNPGAHICSRRPDSGT
jgi:epoxyqueuosine reductase